MSTIQNILIFFAVGLALLKKAGVVRKSEDLIGKICCEDTDGKNENTEENNDTVMIEG